MHRPVLVALLLAFPVAAEDLDQLKKQMPKDQVAIVEQMEEFRSLGQKRNDEPNGLKRKEIDEKMTKLHESIISKITAKLQKEGITDWVLPCKEVGLEYLTLSVTPWMELAISYQGMANVHKDTVRGLKPLDLVRFSLKPRKGGDLMVYQEIWKLGRVAGASVKVLEKK